MSGRRGATIGALRRIATLAAALVSALAVAGGAQAEVTRYLTGDPADVTPPLSGPAHDFGGGSTDVDAALQWMIDEVRGCTECATTVDVVILRASGADGYNESVFAMPGVDSVETLVVTTARDASSAAVERTVRNAEVVFFAGGDQCDYVRVFKGTRVQAAVESVYARGGGIGGTSAGAAIQGEFTYDGCRGSVTSAEALADPYHRRVHFTYGFFRWAHLEGVLTDTHFVARDRMGRLLAFLARQIRDRRAPRALGLAVNEATSVVIDRNGLATVLGAGPAYVVHAARPPETCVRRRPLTAGSFVVCRVASGGTYDLRARPTAGCAPLVVAAGKLGGNPY